MKKLSETRFTIEKASISSEFGYCWLTRPEVKQLYILNLEGYFEVGSDRKFGSVCIQSKNEFEPLDLEQVDEHTIVRKQINLGKIELRSKEPNGFIEITETYLKHIWSLCDSGKYNVIITFTTEESVLEVREVASIFVEIEKRELTHKRRFFW
ncbi:MAG: hypothetical protein AAGJ90_09025 [Pseudomonadota bacterium]